MCFCVDEGVMWVRLVAFSGMQKILLLLFIELRDYTLQTLAEVDEEVSSKSHNKINADEAPLIEAEIDKEEDTEKSKASSLRSVTLWVRNASIFFNLSLLVNFTYNLQRKLVIYNSVN